MHNGFQQLPLSEGETVAIKTPGISLLLFVLRTIINIIMCIRWAISVHL